MKKQDLIDFIKMRVSDKSAQEIGGFSGKFDFGDQFLLAATDGIGTKLDLSRWCNDYSTVGHDLVAVSVNDIVAHGGKPLFFLDYMGCDHINYFAFEVILRGITQACETARCLLIGGETAELPYTYTDSHFDMAGFAVGIVDKDKILPKNNIVPGDVILGLSSDGIHSSGFREIFERTDLKLLPHRLLKPTRIYVRPCLNVLAQTDQIKALVHITGGGLTENIPRVLPPGLSFKLGNWDIPEIFQEIKTRGHFSQTEMLGIFNCGVGMAVIIDKRQVKWISKLFKDEGEQVQVIGEVMEGLT